MFIFFIFLFLFPIFSLASVGASAGTPWSLIISQVVNFFALLILGKIFLKKPLQVAVKNQKDNFLLAEENISKSANEAQSLFKEWQEKWDDLSSTFTQKLNDAKTRSLQLSTENLEATTTQVISISQKAKDQVQTELSLAKAQLAELLLETSCDSALDNQKKQTSVNNISTSLLEKISKNRALNEKN